MRRLIVFRLYTPLVAFSRRFSTIRVPQLWRMRVTRRRFASAIMVIFSASSRRTSAFFEVLATKVVLCDTKCLVEISELSQNFAGERISHFFALDQNIDAITLKSMSFDTEGTFINNNDNHQLVCRPKAASANYCHFDFASGAASKLPQTRRSQAERDHDAACRRSARPFRLSAAALRRPL